MCIYGYDVQVIFFHIKIINFLGFYNLNINSISLKDLKSF